MRFRLPAVFRPEQRKSTRVVTRLPGLLLLAVLAAPAKAADVDTVVRDYDIDLSQTECRQTAMRLFHDLAADGVPVRELGHIIYYTDTTSTDCGLPGGSWCAGAVFPRSADRSGTYRP